MTIRLDRTAIDTALAEASTTRVLVLESDVLGRVGDLVRLHAPNLPVLLVFDATTWDIAGRAVRASIEQAGITVAGEVRLEGRPQVTPDLANVEIVRNAIEQAGSSILPLAIGSGTINDLTKRAAFEAGLPYAVLATAASMDGYTASGAALIDHGVKQTFACDAPFMVLADRDVIARAPAAMTASGYGDLLGKVTAGADWLIADALGIEPIQRDPWNTVQGPLRDLLNRPERYATGDIAAIEQLFLALAASGLAIQAAGTSRPASGSEHQFSHYWEMRGLERNGVPVSHGFKVGVGSIVSAALYERLLRRDLTGVDVDALVRQRQPWSAIEAEIHALHPVPAIRDKAIEEMRAKFVADDVLASRLERVRRTWPTLRDQLRDQLLSPREIAAMLAGAGAASSPAELGLTREQVRMSYSAATQIRRRYTVFDLTHELGLFDELVEALFRADGYWTASLTGDK